MNEQPAYEAWAVRCVTCDDEPTVYDNEAEARYRFEREARDERDAADPHIFELSGGVVTWDAIKTSTGNAKDGQ